MDLRKNLITIIDVESIGQAQHQQLYSRNRREIQMQIPTNCGSSLVQSPINIYCILKGLYNVCMC